MNKIKIALIEKADFIKKAEISDLDKQILLNAYYDMYKNMIHIKKDNSIIALSNNKYYNSAVQDISYKSKKTIN